MCIRDRVIAVDNSASMSLIGAGDYAREALATIWKALAQLEVSHCLCATSAIPCARVTRPGRVRQPLSRRPRHMRRSGMWA